MSTKNFCDNCNKMLKPDENWMNIELNVRLVSNETYGLKSNYNHWHLCAKCAKKITPKFIKIFKK